MARLNQDVLSGAVGNLIFYTVNGNTYVRSKPGKVKKKRNTPVNPLNTVFGVVSACGSNMLKRLGMELQYHLKRGDYNRLRAWMRNRYVNGGTEGAWPFTVGNSNTAQLNAIADLRDFLPAGITVTYTGSGNIAVGLPAFTPVTDVKAPAYTKQMMVKVMAVTSAFAGSSKAAHSTVECFTIPYTKTVQPAKEVLLKTMCGDNHVALVVIAIEFLTGHHGQTMQVNDDAWLPVGIIAAGRLRGDGKEEKG